MAISFVQVVWVTGFGSDLSMDRVGNVMHYSPPVDRVSRRGAMLKRVTIRQAIKIVVRRTGIVGDAR